MKSTYWQIPICEEDKHKTAFKTSSGLYEYIVLDFGLTNAPATITRFIRIILQKSVSDFTVIYLDDIVCHATTREEISIKLGKSFVTILDNWNIQIGLPKCDFFKTELKYLGLLYQIQV